MRWRAAPQPAVHLLILNAWRKVLPPSELTPENERRFMWLLIKALRIREFAWHQYKAGNLDEKSWQSYMAPVGGLFSTERSKAILNIHTGSPEFTQVLTDYLKAAGKKAA